MRKLLASILLVLTLLVPAAAQTTTLTVDAPDNADQFFTVTIEMDALTGFRGLEFTLSLRSSKVALVGARTTGALGSASASVNEDNKVVVFSPIAVDVSGDIIVLDMIALGSSGDTSHLNITNSTISVGTSQPVPHDIVNDVVTLGECVDYENTHTGDGSIIPGTSCACNTGSVLVISPTTNQWSCDPTNATEVFLNSQDCELGGDPIYETGYCCIDGYQLNQSFNNFDDLLGNPNLACTLIPNAPPVANIFQLPDEVIIGNATVFSSLGSVDNDGEIVSFDWNFGDNTTHSNLENPSHVYTDVADCPDGICTVTLIVTDDDGATDTFQDSLTLVAVAGIEAPEPVCGNGIVEETEVCDGEDSAACQFGCQPTCTCSFSSDVLLSPETGLPLTIDVGKTYSVAELGVLGLSLGADTKLDDGRIVSVNSLGTITDIRPAEEPPKATACGNGMCEVGENSALCLQDCHFGDRVCQPSLGETPENAPLDCEERGNFGAILVVVLLIAIIGGGLFFAIRRGWLNFGPLMHHSKQGPSGGKSFDLHRLAEAHQVTAPHNDTGKLVNYIKSSRRQGFSFSEIKASLMKKGWREDKINAAFSNSA